MGETYHRLGRETLNDKCNMIANDNDCQKAMYGTMIAPWLTEALMKNFREISVFCFITCPHRNHLPSSSTERQVISIGPLVHHGVWMGVGSLCPSVHNDIVNPFYWFRYATKLFLCLPLLHPIALKTINSFIHSVDNFVSVWPEHYVSRNNESIIKVDVGNDQRNRRI